MAPMIRRGFLSPTRLASGQRSIRRLKGIVLFAGERSAGNGTALLRDVIADSAPKHRGIALSRASSTERLRQPDQRTCNCNFGPGGAAPGPPRQNDPGGTTRIMPSVLNPPPGKARAGRVVPQWGFQAVAGPLAEPYNLAAGLGCRNRRRIYRASRRPWRRATRST